MPINEQLEINSLKYCLSLIKKAITDSTAAAAHLCRLKTRVSTEPWGCADIAAFRCALSMVYA